MLRMAGLLHPALTYWVRWQASLEAEWPADEEKAFMDKQVHQWLAKNSIADKGLSAEELRAKLRVPIALARWSRQNWGHRLESLYLKRKSGLDRASCRLLFLNNKNFALEIYHRIKACETSFEQAVRDYDQGPYRGQDGLLKLQPLESIPFGLAPVLSRLEPGSISMPLRIDSGFCIVRLEKFLPTKLDNDTEELLLSEQLRLWVDLVVGFLVDDL